VKTLVRALALDIGTRRIGLARSDALGLTAQTLGMLEVRRNPDRTLEELADRIREEQAEILVVGLPRNMDGSLGPKALEVRQFVEDLLKRVDLPVEYVDERLTTVSAQRVLLEADVSRKKRRQVVDGMAAAIILQTWLDTGR